MSCVPRTSIFSAFFFLITSLPAFGESSDPPIDDGTSSVVGNSLNGRSLGIGLSFERGDQVTLPDGTVFSAKIQHGVIKVLPFDNSRITGEAPGTTLTVEDAVGKLFILGIDSSKPLPTGELTYKFWRTDSISTDALQALCPDDIGQPSYGMILPNHWDEKTGTRIDGGYTFACPGGALYKCAIAGYNPWFPDRVDLHQACTRLIRADYCGDGHSHTRDGTHIYFGGDSLGIHSMELSSSRIFEAAWTTKGAKCLGIAQTDHSPLVIVKRWADLWRHHLCLIPYCTKSILLTPSEYLLLSACEPTEDQPYKCSPPVN